MKRVKNLYEKIYDFETLLYSFGQARKRRRYNKDILKFAESLEENLIDIQNSLIHKTYKVGRYREFYVYDPKKRLIMALPVRDRVVQWAIYSTLNPLFMKSYITDSHGCVMGRGTLSAVKRLKYWLRKVAKSPCKYYFLKLDISKYFYRIDHAILLEIIGRKIADPDVMWLLDTIINSEDKSFGLPVGFAAYETDERLHDVGMPIGNLTSQMFANIYLNEVDQYIKRTLGVRYYIRYMDDMIILSDDKKKLQAIKQDVEIFLSEKLRLSLNKKTCIRPISLGIDFLGYKIWPIHTKLRKKAALKMKKRLKYIQKLYARGEIDFKTANAVVQSYLGIMRHCNSYRLKYKIFGDFVLKRNDDDLVDGGGERT